MASRRRMPPAIEATVKVAAARLIQEGKLTLARASSALFQSLANDARRIPQLVKEEASKIEGMLDAFIGEISNASSDDPADDAAGSQAARETSQQTPRAKKPKKRKTRR